jgi:hypothetical protein
MMKPIPRPQAALAFPPMAVLLLAGLAACSQQWSNSWSPAAQGAGANPKAVAACREHANQVYDMQNPSEVYRADMAAGGQRNAPFAGAGQYYNPTAGLTARYTYDTMLNDCLNGISVSPSEPYPGASGTTPPAGTPPAPSSAPHP